MQWISPQCQVNLIQFGNFSHEDRIDAFPKRRILAFFSLRTLILVHLRGYFACQVGLENSLVVDYVITTFKMYSPASKCIACPRSSSQPTRRCQTRECRKDTKRSGVASENWGQKPTSFWIPSGWKQWNLVDYKLNKKIVCTCLYGIIHISNEPW